MSNYALTKHKILSCESILSALKRINANKNRFLIVVDRDDQFCGVITDGDIRRAIISGKEKNDSIEDIYTKKPVFVYEDSSFIEAIDIFKNQSIYFIPIITRERKLKNFITKKQMHALLLQDIRADFSYDFQSINDEIVDYEIFQRPWGFYKTTVYNEYFQSKIISVYPGQRLSLQSHRYREEHWLVVHGTGLVQIDDSIIQVSNGNSIFIPKGAKHRITNTNDNESLILTEVQIGSYLKEDDIVRYEDDYGRVIQGEAL